MNSFNTIWANGRGNLATWLLWGLAAAFVVYTFASGGYLIAVLQFALIYTVLVTGLNIFMGFTGQVSFGHNAFAAIGGYSSARFARLIPQKVLRSMVVVIGLSMAAWFFWKNG